MNCFVRSGSGWTMSCFCVFINRMIIADEVRLYNLYAGRRLRGFRF